MRRHRQFPARGWVTSLHDVMDGHSDGVDYHNSGSSSLTSTNVDESLELPSPRFGPQSNPFQRQYKQYRIKRPDQRGQKAPLGYVEDYFQSLEPPPRPPSPVRPVLTQTAKPKKSKDGSLEDVPRKPLRIRRPKFGKSLMELSHLNEISCDDALRRQKENELNQSIGYESYWDSEQLRSSPPREHRGHSPSKRQINRIRDRTKSSTCPQKLSFYSKPEPRTRPHLSHSTPNLWEWQENPYPSPGQGFGRDFSLWQNAQRYKGSTENLLDDRGQCHVRGGSNPSPKRQPHPAQELIDMWKGSRSLRKFKSMVNLPHRGELEGSRNSRTSSTWSSNSIQESHFQSHHLYSSYQNLVKSLHETTSLQSHGGSRMSCYSDYPSVDTSPQVRESQPPDPAMYDPDFPHIVMCNPRKAHAFNVIKKHQDQAFNNLYPSKHNRFGFPLYPEREFGIPSELGPVSFAGFTPGILAKNNPPRGPSSLNPRQRPKKKKLNMFLRHFAQNF